ncbi:unnamed protein product, partial [Acidocella sp. C78]
VRSGSSAVFLLVDRRQQIGQSRCFDDANVAGMWNFVLIK